MRCLLSAADVAEIPYLVAQAAGIVGVVISFFVFSARKRSTILISKLTCDLLWAAHYSLIGAYSGAAINIIAIGRESVFYNKKKKWASSILWLWLFVALTVISSVLSWEGPLSFLPMIGSCCSVVSFWCTNPMHIRLLALPCQTLWLIYGILHHSVPSTVSCSVALAAIFIGLYRDIKSKNKNEK